MVLIPKKQFMWLILFNKIENLCLATGHEKELECTHIIMYIQMTIILQPVFKLKKKRTLFNKKTYNLHQKTKQKTTTTKHGIGLRPFEAPIKRKKDFI